MLFGNQRAALPYCCVNCLAIKHNPNHTTIRAHVQSVFTPCATLQRDFDLAQLPGLASVRNVVAILRNSDFVLDICYPFDYASSDMGDGQAEENEMRQKQKMTVDELTACYAADLDRGGYILDDEWLEERGLTESTTVRFTTDSLDRFDGESMAGIQADC